MMIPFSSENKNEVISRYESNNRSQRYALVREFESKKNRLYVVNYRKLSTKDFFRTFCFRLLEDEKEKGILASFNLDKDENGKFVVTFSRMRDDLTLGQARLIIQVYCELLANGYKVENKKEMDRMLDRQYPR